MWNVDKVRADFPILNQTIHGQPLAYLDNAATTQKPVSVIEALSHYYTHDNANVHRGLHTLSMRATEAYEAARQSVARYIHAPEASACIFVRGTTEGINLVAQAYLCEKLKVGDEVLITHLEHHSNIVPWQLVCEKTGAKLVVAPLLESGELDFPAFLNCLSKKTKLLAFTYASNALGSILPAKAMVDAAHAVGAAVLIDGAQAMPHFKVDVQELGCDFFVFSGHKTFAPTGIGVLWGRAEHLEAMSVYQGGGEMIQTVSFEGSTYAPIPAKFEAGTPNISGAIGLGCALNYLSALDFKQIHAHEAALLAYATQGIKSIGGYRVIGEASEKVPLVSFVHDAIHAHDVGTILDEAGVASRSGHHCAMPLMNYYQVPATSRISFAFYNTKAEVDQCLEALEAVKRIFQ